MSVSAPTFQSSQGSHGFYILCPARSKVSLPNGSPGIPTWVPQGLQWNTLNCALSLSVSSTSGNTWRISSPTWHFSLHCYVTPFFPHASPRLLLSQHEAASGPSHHFCSSASSHPIATNISSATASCLAFVLPYSRTYSAGSRSTSGKALLLWGWRPF